ncbi:Arachidonate 15-lipoxygenase precursor (15-LOX) [Plesiocystis pacifica SIR-1]|uniref:Arachidonate 15-lipoxygenase (15-LOX) n=1 Tax=Plesiocystis pacifica SIR-1 TaxID=391625 RepID=A6G9N6_9BACT|nr:lipoxygenase family protein [Plesiocystis pacifica]EDM77430.1 Arachidonate 15-lipoxygenase precursor (15-LOX) [Plesiocystis pacifica SIR-1]
MTKIKTETLPSIPLDLSPEQARARAFECELARTAYNYTFSYLRPVSLAAKVPPGQGFNEEYVVKFGAAVEAVAENYLAVMKTLLGEELEGQAKKLLWDGVKALRRAVQSAEDESRLELDEASVEGLESLLEVLELPNDLVTILAGLEQSFAAYRRSGPTALLEYPLRDTLVHSARHLLTASSTADFAKLFQTLPQPLSLSIPPRDWMQLGTDEQPWEQDWYFGYEQIAGYNTTRLMGVKSAAEPERGGVELGELLAKMPISDEQLQHSVGDPSLTLEQAVSAKRLYVCDYSMFAGIEAGELFGRQRYLSAPLALFYWNPSPPPGYPPVNEHSDGAMQPVAIQLGQEHHPERTPIFTPADGTKWAVAKYFVQNACGVEHETIAHLTKTHLVIEPMIVATHRRLPSVHPIFVLLQPHFQFTLAINEAAMSSLIIPGGTIPVVLSPSWKGSMDLIRGASEDWRFDEQTPQSLFVRRGVGDDALPQFPFRDDTSLIWAALVKFVRGYIELYYTSDAEVVADAEIQAWVNELSASDCAAVKGMDGLQRMERDGREVAVITTREYLTRVVAMMIYIAGPLHASVNYAQYPLMSFIPSVSGTAYKAPPTASEVVEDPLEWMPPLDIALYQLSFLYILSAIQYDTFGVYSPNPRKPYFLDPAARALVGEFRYELAQIERTIHERNLHRPYPYQLQLPSRMPNSISS